MTKTAFIGFSALLVMLCACVDLCGQQLMSAGQVQAIRNALPILEDEEAHARLHDPGVIWYTSAEMPSAYQMRNQFGLGRTTFYWTGYNVSADRTDAGRPGHGTWANEFPWTAGKPGGAHRAASVTSVKGFKFTKPVIAFNRIVPGDPDLASRDIIVDWVFADGSYFVEIMMQRLSGLDTVFEIRERIKAGTEWEVDVHRPFGTAAQLAEALEALEGGEHRTAAIAHLRDNTQTRLTRLADLTHDVKRAFDVTTQEYALPRIDSQHVLALLDRPFVSVLGEKFAGEATGPVNQTGSAHIIPSDYFAAHVTATGTSQDCMSCHDSAGRHGMDFQRTVIFNGRRVPRGAYGHIPGSYSDGILSWHPVEPRTVARNGSRMTPVIRRAFLAAGLVRRSTSDTLPAGYHYSTVD